MIVVVAGVMEHKDSAGNHGVITNGGVQWMTAGRGVFGLGVNRLMDTHTSL